jgi:tripartite-type tricarboxylate transporter receptor subunit TctC
MQFKNVKKNLSLAVSSLLFFFFLTPPTGETAEFPTRPISAISPSTPGGLFDTVGRPFTVFAEKHLGQPVVMVNKPGATMMLGGLVALEAPADGYTLLFSGSAMHLALIWEGIEGRKPPVALQDFIPLGAFCLTPPVIVVPYESSWKTLEDLIKDCKAKPGSYAFCSGGLYGTTHTPVEILMLATGIAKARHVLSGGVANVLLRWWADI